VYKTVIKEPSRKYEIRNKRVKKIKKEFLRERNVHKRKQQPQFTVKKKIVNKDGRTIKKVKRRQYTDQTFREQTNFRESPQKQKGISVKRNKRYKQVLTGESRKEFKKSGKVRKQFKTGNQRFVQLKHFEKQKSRVHKRSERQNKSEEKVKRRKRAIL
jgi:hypothetical protein